MNATRPPASDGSALVTFIQPYVPTYRVPLFDELSRLLGEAGARLVVAHGEPEGLQAARSDSRAGAWSQPLRTRRVRPLGHSLSLRATLPLARASDLVVAELASSNLDTYRLALDSHVRLMLWGHGRAYVTESSPLDSRLELWLARRAERLFLYTEGGAAYLRAQGIEESRITVVRNSTDTVALRAAGNSLSEADIRAWLQDWDIPSGPVACFVGSFDDSKQLPLLFAAARQVAEKLPNFTLVVAGAGPQQGLVDAAARRWNFVRVLPRTDGRTLALLGKTASLMVVPGRVGLVAVDALALGLPVVTTDFPRHAPEAEYLDQATMVSTPRTAKGLAAGMLRLLTDPQRQLQASRAAHDLGDGLSIQATAAAFAGPILEALSLTGPGLTRTG